MRRLLLMIGCAVLLAGCGGASSGKSAQDEAGVGFNPPMLLSAVLELARRHHVQPIELTMEFPVVSETISTHAVIEDGMTDTEIERSLREARAAWRTAWRGRCSAEPRKRICLKCNGGLAKAPCASIGCSRRAPKTICALCAMSPV